MPKNGNEDINLRLDLTLDVVKSEQTDRPKGRSWGSSIKADANGTKEEKRNRELGEPRELPGLQVAELRFRLSTHKSFTFPFNITQYNSNKDPHNHKLSVFRCLVNMCKLNLI